MTLQFDALTAQEQQNLVNQRSWVQYHPQARDLQFGNTVDGKLQLLQAILQADPPRPDEVDKLQALGVWFGDCLAETTGMSWVALNDHVGRELALHLEGTQVMVLPLEIFATPLNGSEPVPLAVRFKRACAAIAKARDRPTQQPAVQPQGGAFAALDRGLAMVGHGTGLMVGCVIWWYALVGFGRLGISEWVGGVSIWAVGIPLIFTVPFCIGLARHGVRVPITWLLALSPLINTVLVIVVGIFVVNPLLGNSLSQDSKEALGFVVVAVLCLVLAVLLVFSEFFKGARKPVKRLFRGQVMF